MNPHPATVPVPVRHQPAGKIRATDRAGAALSDTGSIRDREHVVVVPARVAIGRHDAML
jgi:hypothetical protein